MQVIITGGTGLIGGRLAAAMAADDHEIIVLSRNPQKHTFPNGVRGVKWDSKTAADWGELADGADAIVNLAGAPIDGGGLFPQRWTAERKRRIRQSRIDAGRAITEAVEAAANKPGVVIQISGVDHYGHVPSDEIITEEAPQGDSFLADVTVDWESATAPVEEIGVRRCVIRSAMALSMEGGPLPITVLPFRFFVGGPLGSGEQWWPWIHIEDEVRVIRFLIENQNASGVFNACAPNPVKQKTFARTIGQALNRPSLLPVPAFALKLILGEVSDTVLHGRRAIPVRLEQLGFTFKYPQLADALEDLLH